MPAVISVENLGKKYLLKHQASRESYPYLRDALTDGMKNLGRRLLGQGRKSGPCSGQEEFWALRDISFDVEQGERIGIIGRNGAGKSTLLKILGRITEPTTGCARIRGRVASLLEIGAGFHRELTGRENIFLNGAILGMSRAEIKKKFDEIVDFAEIEKFLDTPVKRYSSGMYVRLAFAVAAHLEPEILIVDEVLAVGDAQFQKKCLGKMEEVGREGRTILFVSHNMNAIEELCGKAVLIKNGGLKRYDGARDVIKEYLFGDQDHDNMSLWSNESNEYDNSWFKPLKFYLCRADGSLALDPIGNNEDVFITIEAEIDVIDPALTVGYAVYNDEGQSLYWSYNTDSKEANWPVLKKGINVLRSRIPKRLLNEGTYKFELLSSLHFRQWLTQPGKAPCIHLTIQGGLSDSPYWMLKRPCLLAPVIEWESV